MSRSPVISSRLLAFALLLLAAAVAPMGDSAYAQEIKLDHEEGQKPIFVTTRVFQMIAAPNGKSDLSDQIFKMRTSSLSDDEKWMNSSKWMNAFKKTYPGFEINLLKDETRRIFRTAKPSVITLGAHPDGRRLEIQMIGANSPGEGDKFNTTIIPEIGLHFPRNPSNKPVLYSIQPIEIESGMTYFYAVKNLKFTSDDYVKFIRTNAPAGFFDGQDIHLLFAFSVELDKAPDPARYYDERQSLKLQEQAIKNPQPRIPSKIIEAGLGGMIRTRIEISPDGKVANAGIQYSSIPELNNEALIAARQWEFPGSLFAEDKKPITAFIVFNITVKPEQNAEKNN